MSQTKLSLIDFNFPENYSTTSKSDVYNFLINIFEHKSNILFIENGFKNYFPELYKDLCSIDFPTNFKFTQKLYHYFNDDQKLLLGTCIICGERCKFITLISGYNLYCSHNCRCLDNQNIYEKSKLTKKERYGDENYNNPEKMFQTKEERYNNPNYNNINQCKLTKKERYGDENYNNPEKMFQTKEERYGDVNYNNRKKAAETCLEKYGEDNFEKTKEGRKKQTEHWASKSDGEMLEFKNNCKKYWNNLSDVEKTKHSEKIFESRKNNHTINTSKIEEQFAQYLTDININFIRQYRDDRYSHNGYKFCCDFYLPDYDLFIEIQGSWTHGKHPFDETNPNDIAKLNTWKSKGTNYYNNAIQVWTIKDTLKRKIAKENGLKYIEIFSYKIDEAIKEFSKLHKI